MIRVAIWLITAYTAIRHRHKTHKKLNDKQVIAKYWRATSDGRLVLKCNCKTGN